MMRMNKGAVFHNVVLTATAYVDETFPLFDAFGYVDAMNDAHGMRFIYALVDNFGIGRRTMVSPV